MKPVLAAVQAALQIYLATASVWSHCRKNDSPLHAYFIYIIVSM